MTITPRDLDAVLTDLRAAVSADASRRERSVPLWRRRRFLALALVPALLGLGTGAWALTELRGEDVAYGIECHEEPQLGGNVGILTADGRDPAAACAESMWPGGNAPALVACADREHPVVRVFPGSDAALCQRLGLAQVPGDYRQAAERTHLMLVELQSRLNRRPCYSEPAAREIAGRVLERHGFRDWGVKTIGFERYRGEDRFCATGDYTWFDPQEKVAGITGTTTRRWQPAEAALEQPGCRGIEQAVAAVAAGLRELPEAPDSVTAKATVGAEPDRPCTDYGIVDWEDEAPVAIVGELGPSDSVQ